MSGIKQFVAPTVALARRHDRAARAAAESERLL